MKANCAIGVLSLYLLVSAYYFWKILSTHSLKHSQTDQVNHHHKTLGNVIEPHVDFETAELTESEKERKYWDQWSPHSSSRFARSKSSSAVGIQRFDNESIHPLQTDIKLTVDVWSNNGLGDYLWYHLLHGRLRPHADHLYSYGEKVISNIKFRYKTGKGLDVGFLPDSSENIVLILNGRAETTRKTVLQWLDELSNFPSLQNVGLVMIGDEQCKNEWLLPYIHTKNSSALKFVYLVYDSPMVDNVTVFQFPLGVATYRGFPLPMMPDVAVFGQRPHRCNFLGTIHANSSRQTLIALLNQMDPKEQCFVKARQRAVEQQVWTLATCIAQRIGAIIMLLTVQGKFSLVKLLRHHHRHSAARRPVTDSTALATAGTIADTIADKWQAGESEDSLNFYLDILKSSDLTLCPVGFNSESYRIYEAMSVGSIPVIEDKTTPGQCDSSPFRLLKQYAAPVLYVKDWSELPKILSSEALLSLPMKEKRRLTVISWYSKFRHLMAERFVKTVTEKFLAPTQ